MSPPPPTPAQTADETAADERGVRIAVAFCHLLRRAGVAVSVGAVADYAEALGRTGLGARDPVYWAGRATLVRRPEHLGSYDRAFAAFWWAAEITDGVGGMEPAPLAVAVEDPGCDPGGDEPADDPADGDVLAVRWSRHEVLAAKDFAECNAAELAEIRALMGELRVAGSRRRARRHRAAAGVRGRPDLRRTVRRAMRTGGEPVRRHATRPGDRPRPIVVLVDVSGSMQPYARALLRFAHVAVAGRTRVEAFTFGTRLTRVTRQLMARDPDAALHAATDAVRDWSGGTRIGESIQEFNTRWGVRGMARGAIVVVLSDGWDRGEAEMLGEQMARLSRVAHRVVWVNPLKHTPGYAPLARGMAAALPYVDDLIEGHSLDALAGLAELIDR